MRIFYNEHEDNTPDNISRPKSRHAEKFQHKKLRLYRENGRRARPAFKPPRQFFPAFSFGMRIFDIEDKDNIPYNISRPKSLHAEKFQHKKLRHYRENGRRARPAFKPPSQFFPAFSFGMRIFDNEDEDNTPYNISRPKSRHAEKFRNKKLRLCREYGRRARPAFRLPT